MATKLHVWKDRHEAAKTERQKIESDAKKCCDFYGGNHWNNITTTYDQITINYIKTIVDTIRDSVYFQNPSFIFNSSPKNASIAKVLTEIFPHLLKTIMYKHHTKLCLFDALRVGFAWKWNGYTFSGDSTNDSLKPDEVFSIWVPWDNVWLEADANGLWDANFLFLKEVRTVKSIKNNHQFNVPKDFKPSYELARDGGKAWRNHDDDMQRSELIHVYDRGEGTHKIFTSENRNWLFSEDWPLGDLNLFPLNMLRLNEDGLYPGSPIKPLLPINEEINKMESMRITHAKRFNRKYGVVGELSKEQKDALESGYDGAVISELEQANQIFPIQDADCNPAVYRSIESLYFVMKLLSRVGEYRFGTMPQGDTTATEASYIESGTAVGNNYYRDTIGDFCERDAEILVQLMKMNYDTARSFEIANQQMVEFTKQDLERVAFRISVDCEGSAPPEKSEQRQEAIALMNLFAADPFVDPLQPRKNVLKTFKTVKNEADWLNSPTTLQAIAATMQQGGKEVNIQAIQEYLANPGKALTPPDGKVSPI